MPTCNGLPHSGGPSSRRLHRFFRTHESGWHCGSSAFGSAHLSHTCKVDKILLGKLITRGQLACGHELLTRHPAGCQSLTLRSCKLSNADLQRTSSLRTGWLHPCFRSHEYRTNTLAEVTVESHDLYRWQRVQALDILVIRTHHPLPEDLLYLNPASKSLTSNKSMLWQIRLAKLYLGALTVWSVIIEASRPTRRQALGTWAHTDLSILTGARTLVVNMGRDGRTLSRSGTFLCSINVEFSNSACSVLQSGSIS